MKSVLITGASSGIGKHMSGVLARRGWVVWAGCRDEGAHEELRKVHPDVRPLIIDVTDSSSIDVRGRRLSAPECRSMQS